MQAAFQDARALANDSTLVVTQLVSMSTSYFEGDAPDFEAKRIVLEPPTEHLDCAHRVGNGDDVEARLIDGVAQVLVLRGNGYGNPPEEVARSKGTYTCCILSGARSMVLIRTVRISGVGRGAR